MPHFPIFETSLRWDWKKRACPSTHCNRMACSMLDPGLHILYASSYGQYHSNTMKLKLLTSSHGWESRYLGILPQTHIFQDAEDEFKPRFNCKHSAFQLPTILQPTTPDNVEAAGMQKQANNHPPKRPLLETSPVSLWRSLCTPRLHTHT